MLVMAAKGRVGKELTIFDPANFINKMGGWVLGSEYWMGCVLFGSGFKFWIGVGFG